MIKRITFGLLFVGVACAASTARASELKTADEVIAKYIEAIGGRKALDAAKTQRMTGTNSLPNGMQMPIVMEYKRPNMVRVEMQMQGMTGIQAFDGETGWYIMPFAGSSDPEKMPPEQAEQLKSQADVDGPLVDHAEKGHEVELLGTEDVEGTKAYKLKIAYQDERVEYYYLDAEYFLPIKITGKREMQGTMMEFEATPGDYKKVGGLLLPHSITQQLVGMPMKVTMTFDKIEVNVDIPDSRFEMPKPKEPVEPEESEEPESDENTGH